MSQKKVDGDSYKVKKMNSPSPSTIRITDIPALIESPSKECNGDDCPSFCSTCKSTNKSSAPSLNTTKDRADSFDTFQSFDCQEEESFTAFRLKYMLTYAAITLADGLQGTHVYVLYDSYGFSPSSLYALGFVSGAISSPWTGAIIDKIGRKNAAILYCFLEISINYLEQQPAFHGLVLGRVLTGITTNMYYTAFESYLVTEIQGRGFSEENLETVLCDSSIMEYSSSILSGILAHALATSFGPVGPFKGAVAITLLALVLITGIWSETYDADERETKSSLAESIKDTYKTIRDDSVIARIGLLQGLAEGTLETFLFLWSPALTTYAINAPNGTLGLDKNGEPTYGLIFGGFMFCAVMGSLLAPIARKALSNVVLSKASVQSKDEKEDEEEKIDPIPVSLLCALLYVVSGFLFLIPCVLKPDSPYGFSVCLFSFFAFEFMVGLSEPLGGIVRSVYIPTWEMCSIVNVLRVLTNLCIAVGVFSTEHVSLTKSFGFLSAMMVIAAFLQLTLVPWTELLHLGQHIKCMIKASYSPFFHVVPIVFAIWVGVLNSV